MTRKSRREIERAVEDLTDGEGEEGEEETVLVVGGDPNRAGLMTEAEYRAEYSEEERERGITCDCELNQQGGGDLADPLVKTDGAEGEGSDP